MKAQLVGSMLVAALVLSACGEKHEKVYAVDKVEEAQAAALAKAPKAEEIVFDDAGQPPFAEPAKPAAEGEAAKAEGQAVTDAKTAAHHGAAEQPADAKTEEAKPADATQPADTAKTEEAKPAESK